MPRRVVLATDGSPSALAAARYVTTMGLDPAEIELTVLHVLPRARTYAASYAAAGTLPPAAPTRAGRAEGGRLGLFDNGGAPAATLAPTAEAGAAVGATLAMLGPLTARAHVQLARGSPAREIVDFARRSGADLIVVGKRGHSPADDPLLGSVCAQVLHTAPCAVLVVGWPAHV